MNKKERAMPEDPNDPTITPVDLLADDDRPRGGKLEDGTALCLSGGGYRAMLFHLGTLWALNDHAWLPKLDRVSSVSGGSITAAVLGMNWGALTFDRGRATNFADLIVKPVRGLAGKTLDIKAVLNGLFKRGSISDKLIAAYDKELFKKKTLQDLPERPRFVINATSVQSAALFRFSKPYIWDYRVGKIDNPAVSLAAAVGASSAFPPVLSPMTLDVSKLTFVPKSGTDLQKAPYTDTAILTDGGVYDNMGIETAWKRYRRILVSDAGGKTQADGEPSSSPIKHSLRVNALIDNQVRSLRKRQVIDSYIRKSREGSYWGIRSDIANYAVSNALPAPFARTLELAETPTRLAAMDAELQERLINWGYAITDAAMRKHVDPALKAPGGFPYPRGV
jgi:NTE family protein